MFKFIKNNYEVLAILLTIVNIGICAWSLKKTNDLNKA